MNILFEHLKRSIQDNIIKNKRMIESIYFLNTK